MQRTQGRMNVGELAQHLQHAAALLVPPAVLGGAVGAEQVQQAPLVLTLPAHGSAGLHQGLSGW